MSILLSTLTEPDTFVELTANSSTTIRTLENNLEDYRTAERDAAHQWLASIRDRDAAEASLAAVKRDVGSTGVH